jgi:hypothetical protein
MPKCAQNQAPAKNRDSVFSGARESSKKKRGLKNDLKKQQQKT